MTESLRQLVAQLIGIPETHPLIDTVIARANAGDPITYGDALRLLAEAADERAKQND